MVDAWAPVLVSDAALEQFQVNPDDEIRLMADLGGETVGLGVLEPNGSELRACYVLPGFARRGVGTALVKEIEHLARARGLTHLHLESSLTAEPFYGALGYDIVERTEHVLRSGVAMAAVRMMKVL